VFRNRIETLVSAATVEAENVLGEIIRCLQRQGGGGEPVRKHPAVKPEIREVTGKPARKFRETPSHS
jgi:hypothetical protein